MVVFSLLPLISSFALAQEGPGNGLWQSHTNMDPDELCEEHGLIKHLLQTAAWRIGDIPGRKCFMAISDGFVVAEEYYEDHQESSVLMPFSASKAWCTLGSGALNAQGKLNMDDRLVDLGLPDEVTSRYHEDTTLRHIVSMTSGRPPMGEDSDPGTFWQYDMAGVNLDVQNDIIEALNDDGISSEEFIRNIFVNYLGTQDTVFDTFNNRVNCGAGPSTSCRDFARVGQLMLNGGKWAGQPDLFTDDWMQNYREPLVPETNTQYAASQWLNNEIATEENDLFWQWPLEHDEVPRVERVGRIINQGPTDMLMMMGASDQYTFVMPDRNAVVVVMGEGNDENAFAHVIFQHIDAATQKHADCYVAKNNSTN